MANTERRPPPFRSEAIFTPSPGYPSCHAATIVDLPNGNLLAAWFAGTHEGHPDVAIWLAGFDGARWSEPKKVADEPDIPLWNPVLFLDAEDAVWLFYKVAPIIPAWTGAHIRSNDGGVTWSLPVAMPAGLLGPAKNKPIILNNGNILCGTSSESWRAWSCWAEVSSDGGRTWTKHGPVHAPDREAERGDQMSANWDTVSHQLVLPQEHAGVIQPTVWEYAPGRLKMLMRSTRRVGVVCASTSDDYGRTWSPAVPTDLPNPNSGLDAVRLSDGRVVLACNPTREGRSPLSFLVSEDDGATWRQRLDVETGPGEFSYPSIIQASNGWVHLVYTYRREHIRHVTFDPRILATT